MIHQNDFEEDERGPNNSNTKMRTTPTEHWNKNMPEKTLLGTEQIKKERFDTFCSDVTLHGFRYLFEGTPLRRLGWLLVCASMFTISVLLFYNLVEDFYDRKTVTSNFVVIHPELNFPTITVCPLAPRSKSKLQRLSNRTAISTDDYLKFFQNLTSQPDPSDFFKNPKIASIVKKLRANNMTSHADLLYGHQQCGNE